MNNFKFALAFILISLTYNSFARPVAEMQYDGVANSQSLYLSLLKIDDYGNYSQTKTEAKFFFDKASREFGKGISIIANMNGADVGAVASNDTNTLALLKHKSTNYWFTENTLNVYMEVDVRFLPDLKAQISPYLARLDDLSVIDDYVSFTSGKITDVHSIKAHLNIVRKKVLSKDEIVFDRLLSEKEFVVTGFGSDRSLVSIDLSPIISRFERGKKHVVTVTLVPSFGKWRAFTGGQANLFKSPAPINVESDFRYSR